MSSGRTGLSFVLVLAIGCVAALLVGVAPPAGRPLAAPASLPATLSPLARDEWGEEPLHLGQGCTTVYATDGQHMLGGNNEDYIDPLTKVWFVPAEAGTFGRVYFGFENYFAQGGMNDQGLFFDSQAVDTALPVPLEGKRQFTGTIFLDYVMARCATVACVVEMFETYYAQETWTWQHLFGDATGESAIIEPQTILRQRGGYQVATNFYQSAVPPEERERVCWRYKTATSMLQGSPALSVEYMRDVMAAVHQGVQESRTLYTNVYDLANRMVYLYYFFDYEHVVAIDLEEELGKGAHAYDLPALFPPNPTAEEFSAPILSQYHSLIRSRLAGVDPAFLAAYAGDYELPEGWGAPDDRISVVAHDASLMMIFPDFHRYELFPQSETSFFTVIWGDIGYEVRFDANFGLDTAGRVLYLELVYGGDNVRINRIGPESFVPYVPTPVPTVTPWPTTTPRPTATARPTPAPSAIPTAVAAPAPPTTVVATTTPAPSAASVVATPLPLEPAPGFPWGWVIVPVALLAAVVGWLALRRRRSARR